MTKINNHEISYRSDNAFSKMQKAKIFICGAGALGSNLANILVRQGIITLSIIDMDRVESHNISNQLYSIRDIGQKKVNALYSNIYQNTKISINTIDKELRSHNVDKLFKDHDLIVDAFDNWDSRRIVKLSAERLSIPCIHAGMSDSGFSEVKWNERYNIPKTEVSQKDVCDYPLASNLVHITASVLAEAIIQFIVSGVRLNRDITLGDLKIHTI